MSQLLQELVDDAVHDVVGEYDDCGVIQSKVIAMTAYGRTAVELPFSGGVNDLPDILASAGHVLSSVGAANGAAVIYISDQGNELIVISARDRDGHNGLCILALQRLTRNALHDIVLIA